MKRYSNCSLALTKVAKGHKCNGLPQIANQKSLEMFKKAINTDIPITLDHGESVISSLGSVGYLDKNSIRIVGKQLVGDVVIPDSSYSKDKLFIGDFIEDKIAKDSKSINLSFESECEFELDVLNKEAVMMPRTVHSLSMVSEGAITNDMFAKFSANRINNSKSNEGNTMTEAEVKSENIIPAEVAPVTKMAQVASKLAAVGPSDAAEGMGNDSVNTVSGSITDAGKDSAVSNSKPAESEFEKAVHAKLDALTSILTTSMAEMKASLAQNSVNPKSGILTTDLSAKKDANEVVVKTVKYSKDIEVVDQKKEVSVNTFSDTKRTLNIKDEATTNANLFWGKA